MKFLITLALLFTGLYLTAQTTADSPNQYPLTIILHGEYDYDHFFFSEHRNGPDQIALQRPPADTFELEFEQPLDSYFAIGFAQPADINGSSSALAHQFWLRHEGQPIRIEMSVDEDAVLHVDTVVNAPFYYYTCDLAQNLMAEVEMTDTTTQAGIRAQISDLTLREFKRLADHRFSNSLSSWFISMNEDRPEELREMRDLMAQQALEIQQDFLNQLSALEKRLSVEIIDLLTLDIRDEYGARPGLKLRTQQRYLIDTWFVACPPCVADHRRLATHQKILRDRGVRIIGLSSDYEVSEWKAYLDDHDYDWTNFIFNPESDDDLQEVLGILSFPTYFVTDGDGKVLFRSISLDQVFAHLDIEPTDK